MQGRSMRRSSVSGNPEVVVTASKAQSDNKWSALFGSSEL